jgi:cysteinyl-tRNA synthetase
MIRTYLVCLLALVALAACSPGSPGAGSGDGPHSPGTAAQPGAAAPPPATSGAPSNAPASPTGGTAEPVTSWVYQLQGYQDDKLVALGRAAQRLVVIDLARDANTDYFRADEISALRRTGKQVLAYFEIGSIEEFRPEYAPMVKNADRLILNRWAEWPDEHFVRYWDPTWWSTVIQPRVDQALKAGFDGVYLDTPLAYEQIDLSLVPGQTRDSLAASMVALIQRISRYAKDRHPAFRIVPQNSPELRRYPGYTGAVDGIGMEELFYQATDQKCTEGFCGENLADTRALRDAGKFVLAVDYARDPAHIKDACQRYRAEHFAGTVTDVELNQIAAPCG